MKNSMILSLVTLTLFAVMGSTSASAGCSKMFRSYYLDRSCHFYYYDAEGQKEVLSGRYVDARFVGLSLKRDASGRVYHQDSFGNRIYMVKHCR